VEKLIRILPYAEADGATNMAADETLLHSAAAGVASLRFYGWSEVTASLGYFQPAAARESDPLLARLPFVRRPTGGATLVHHHEVTYALALPVAYQSRTMEARSASEGGATSSLACASGFHCDSWLVCMHRIITRALASLGVDCKLVTAKNESAAGHVLCFQQHTPGDVLCRGAKVVGSAQRKARQALLQHGSILLRRSEFAPVLPGIRELCGVDLFSEDVCRAVQEAFFADTGWTPVVADWTDDEIKQIDECKASRYQSPSWNQKR